MAGRPNRTIKMLAELRDDVLMPAAYLMCQACPEQYKRKPPDNCGYVAWLWHDLWAGTLDALSSVCELAIQLTDKLAEDTGDTAHVPTDERLANFNRRVRQRIGDCSS
jgi:hypothetical protein